MYDTFVFKQIKRVLRNMLLLNGIIFIAAFTYLLGRTSSFINIVSGPREVKVSQLDTIKTEGIFRRDYIKVTGDEAKPLDVNYVKYEYNKYSKEVKNKTVEGKYMAVRDGKKVVIVLVAPDKIYKKDFSGWLIPLQEGQGDYLRSLAKLAVPDTKDSVVLPYMIDGLIYDQFDGRIIFAAFAALAVTLWNFVRSIKFWFKPERHKIYKSLWRYGDPQKTIVAIENDKYYYEAGVKFGRVTLFKSWLIAESFLSIKVIGMDNVMWMYKKETKQYLNYIPAGKEYSLVACSSDRRIDTIKMKRKDLDDLLMVVKEQYPWIVTGYTEEIKTMWNMRFKDFMAYVYNKKKEAGV